MKMRVLIVSALFACAAAAPSYIAPFPFPQPEVFKTNFPTFAHYQAAVVDAKIEIANHRREIAYNSIVAKQLANLEEQKRYIENHAEANYPGYNSFAYPLGVSPYKYPAVLSTVSYADSGLKIPKPAVPSLQYIQSPFYNPTVLKTVY